jgi:hypothetical protein
MALTKQLKATATLFMNHLALTQTLCVASANAAKAKQITKAVNKQSSRFTSIHLALHMFKPLF